MIKGISWQRPGRITDLALNSLTSNSLTPNSLTPNRVHVWRLLLDQETLPVDSLKDVLSEQEIERAGKFYFKHDQRRYIISRALLRKLLASYSGASPQELSFSRGAHGKPYLDNCNGLAFNLSHAGSWVLIAVAKDRDIGVDVEWLQARTQDRIETIIKRFYAPEEQEFLESLSREERTKFYYTFWVQKEALVKALGENLPALIQRINVLGLGEEGILYCDKGGNYRTSCEPLEPGSGKLWSLNNFNVAAEYTAAVCVEGKRPEFSFWQLEG